MKKSTVSTDGTFRVSLSLKLRVSMFSLLTASCSYTEQTDQYLINITEILDFHQKQIFEYGLYWATDLWSKEFVCICKEHFPYYIGILGKYFPQCEAAEAYKELEKMA